MKKWNKVFTSPAPAVAALKDEAGDSVIMNVSQLMSPHLVLFTLSYDLLLLIIIIVEWLPVQYQHVAMDYRILF